LGNLAISAGGGASRDQAKKKTESYYSEKLAHSYAPYDGRAFFMNTPT
jgi:hypothetical protein